MVRVTLQAVRVDLQSNTPVLLLQETEGQGRTLPIFIGTPEATAIAYAIQGVEVPRPLTHDLMVDLMEALGASLSQVVISALEGATYYADLYLQTERDETVVSARPSDAVALAIRTQTPLFVADDVMNAEAVVMEIEEDEDAEDQEEEVVVDQFREFLDTIQPEDFSG
jgi:bifunctional DNase/RNase